MESLYGVLLLRAVLGPLGFCLRENSQRVLLVRLSVCAFRSTLSELIDWAATWERVIGSKVVLTRTEPGRARIIISNIFPLALARWRLFSQLKRRK